MIYSLTGKLLVKGDTVQVNDKFKKREFVLTKTESNNGMEFIDYIKFQLKQDQCGLLEGFTVGETMSVEFNIKGNKWEKEGKVNYFTNLEAWRLTHTVAESQAPTNEAPPLTEDGFQDLPF